MLTGRPCKPPKENQSSACRRKRIGPLLTDCSQVVPALLPCLSLARFSWIQSLFEFGVSFIITYRERNNQDAYYHIERGEVFQQIHTTGKVNVFQQSTHVIDKHFLV